MRYISIPSHSHISLLKKQDFSCATRNIWTKFLFKFCYELIHLRCVTKTFAGAQYQELFRWMFDLIRGAFTLWHSLCSQYNWDKPNKIWSWFLPNNFLRWGSEISNSLCHKDFCWGSIPRTFSLNVQLDTRCLHFVTCIKIRAIGELYDWRLTKDTEVNQANQVLRYYIFK